MTTNYCTVHNTVSHREQLNERIIFILQLYFIYYNKICKYFKKVMQSVLKYNGIW